MEKNVFVFGAGASIEEGLPSQEKLLETYFKYTGINDLNKKLIPYFRDFFNVNIDNKNVLYPSFEEALGILELAIDKEESYDRAYSFEELREIRKFLVLSIGIAIEKSPMVRKHCYNNLIKKLFKENDFVQDRFGFISFNYDILFDKALMEIVDRDIFIDYGFEFTNEKIAKPPFGKWESPKGKKNINYLKPHGSFNWMCCPKCNSIYLTGEEAGTEKGKFFQTGILNDIEECLIDKTELYNVIEPPSLFKKYRNIYIQIIWNRAYHLLSKANKIIFIGYSMPEADIWFKYLLKRSCFNSKKEFVVINPSEEKELKPRYERLLGNVEFFNINFSKFIDNIDKYLNFEQIVV